MHRRLNSPLFLALAMAFFPYAALAQAIPDAGVLERQLQQNIPSITPAPFITQPPPPETPAGQPVLVRGFVFEGSTLIPTQEFDAVVAGHIGRSLTLPELEHVAEAVAEHYRKRGYFARAYLPAQDVTDGIITIRIVEGRLGEVKLEDNAKRANSSYVRDVVAGGMKKDEPYSALALERNLLIANDLPGIHANGVLSAGKTTGQSDLTVEVKDSPLVSGQAGVNNFGSKATDIWQANTAIAFNNMSGRGDQATLHASASENLAYGQLGYNAPLGHKGLRAGASASYLAYELGDRFETLDAEGYSYTLSANVQYPFIRSLQHSLWGGIEYENRHYADDILGDASQRKDIHAAVASINGDFADSIGKGAFNRYYAEITGGDLDLSDVALAWAADQSGPKTHGQYAKLYGDFTRDQYIAEGWVLRARTAGQLAGKNLDSSEKFALGGPYGVRAYPVNEALGDMGMLLNLELHKAVHDFDIYGFIDFGGISQYNSTWPGWDAGSDVPNSYWLGGTGVGALYPLLGHVNISGVVAMPIGTNKGEPTTDRNQDGSHRGPRVWVGLTQMF